MKLNSVKKCLPFYVSSVVARAFSEAAVVHMNYMVRKLWDATGPGAETLQGNIADGPANLSKGGKVEVCQLWKLKSVLQAAWILDTQKLGKIFHSTELNCIPSRCN
jgi:hypothetical protein